jgi:hypothetical protein
MSEWFDCGWMLHERGNSQHLYKEMGAALLVVEDYRIENSPELEN